MTKMHVRNITGLPAVLDKFDDFARQTVVRAMAEAGITVVAGSFEKGAVVTSSNEGVYQESTGKVYSWFTDATITVPAGTTPQNFGGVNATAWVDRTDVTLRHELATSDGAAKVGNANGGSVQDFIDKVEDGDLTVIADGATTPRRLGERFADVVNVKDFGARGDGVTDDTNAIQAAIDYATNRGSIAWLPEGNYITSDTLTLRAGARLFGVSKGNFTLGYGSTTGAKILYTGAGTAISCEGPLIDVRDFTLRDYGRNASVGLEFVAVTSGVYGCDQCSCDVIINGFTAGKAFQLLATDGGISYGNFKVRVRDAKTFWHIEDNNDGRPVPFGFVNSNSLTLIGSGGDLNAYEYGLRCIGGNDNTLESPSVIEPYKTKFGHMVLERGATVNGTIRIEGAHQDDAVPVVTVGSGSQSKVKFSPPAGQIVNRSREAYMENISSKSLQTKQDDKNRFKNPTFTSLNSSGSLTDWSVTGAGVTYNILDEELESGYKVLKITVPAGVICKLKPSTGIETPDTVYDFLSFGAWIKHDNSASPGSSALTTMISPKGLASSAKHLGDGQWQFVGMSQRYDKTQNPQTAFFLNAGATAQAVFYVTVPTFAFGRVQPERVGTMPITGGKFYGTVSDNVVFVDLANVHGGVNELTLPSTGNVFVITSTTTAKTIARINYASDKFPIGTMIKLVFDYASAGSTVTVGSFIKGRVSVVTDQHSVVELVSDAPGIWRITSVY